MPPSSFVLPVLQELAACQQCAGALPNPPQPVLAASASARLLIVGQAPSYRVQQTGIPWNDASGALLREWLDVSREEFYDANRIAILPMGFCYPGRGKSGDLPPRPECAPLWHSRVLQTMSAIQLVLLIGNYAQRYYLGTQAKPRLTDTVRNWQKYQPLYFPLPHPSPRNRHWLKQNPWFQMEVLPELQARVTDAMKRPDAE